MNRFNRTLTAVGLVCCVIPYGTAVAQTAAVAPAADPTTQPAHNSGELEEIVVTAQRRSQNLQDVPLAITAITGATVERDRLFNISDVAVRTPSFALGQQSPTQPTLTIRGIGSTDREAGSDRSVVPFVDEVYIGRTSAATFDIFDVERVEVLRGPQGTLFGRNVSGGAISITTVKPNDRFEAKAQFGLGNYNALDMRGAINIPVSDRVAFRFTGTAARQNGFYNNVFLKVDGIESFKRYGGRAQVQYDDPGVRTLRLSVDYSHNDIAGIGSKQDPGQNSPALYANSLRTYVTPAFPLRFPAAGAFNVENNIVGFSQSRNLRAYLRYDQDIGFGTLTVLPAVVKSQLHEARDQAGIPVLFAGAQTSGFNSQRDEQENYTAISLETRVAGKIGRDINWLVGGFLLTEDASKGIRFFRQSNNALSDVQINQRASNGSIAGFAQLSWRFVRIFELTAGGRFTRDSKTFSVNTADRLTAADRAAILSTYRRAPSISPLTELYTASAKNQYEAFTPRISISAEPIADQHFYASWARGFKSGGFDGTPPSAIALGSGFQPETVDTYEAGIKSTLFDRRVRANFAAFYSDFNNLQLRDRRVLDPNDITNFVVVVINAARARIQGIEGEIDWKVTRSLNLSLSGSVLDTKVTQIAPGITLGLGTRLPRAPSYQFVASGTYRVKAEDSGLPADLEIGADYQRVGDQFFDINEQLGGKQPAYDLVNARIGIARPEQGWNLLFWGKNLTNTVYFSDAQSTTTATSGRATVRFGAPRTYGATFAVEF